MQAGERRFAQRLGSHLEDDYTCWYEVPVGKRPRYSDFIILHPGRGVLLLEVKDWKFDTIQSIDKVSATIITANGLKTVSNPIEQVRQCTYQLVNRLQKDPQLCHQSGRYTGNLVFPYGFGVVLTSINRKQFQSANLGEVLSEHQTICKDEMVESVDPEAFQERLWNMFNLQFANPLTLPQIDRIRWHLFPEIRVNPAGSGDLFTDAEEPAAETSDPSIPDIVRVMDKQQELLARSPGEGHRVILNFPKRKNVHFCAPGPVSAQRGQKSGRGASCNPRGRGLGKDADIGLPLYVLGEALAQADSRAVLQHHLGCQAKGSHRRKRA